MGTVTHLPSYLGHLKETGTVKFLIENICPRFFCNLTMKWKYLSHLMEGLGARVMHLPSSRTSNTESKMIGDVMMT